MKKRKIGAVALLLVISLLVLASCGNDSFVFREKIRWGMSMKEVTEIEGEGTPHELDNGIVILEYNEIPMSKYQGALDYMFYSDRLICCDYTVRGQNDSSEVINTLKDVLHSEYGNTTEASAKELCEILDVIAPYHDSEEVFQEDQLYRWNAPGNTAVFLVGDEGYQAVLYASPECMKIKQDQGKNISSGGTMTFGHYEQDDNPDNGPEAIEWIVLDVRDGNALLISKYGLDVRKYNNEIYSGNITWETCSLREWLNTDFFSSAFSGNEQPAVIRSSVDNSPSQGHKSWNQQSGNDTTDRLFLLSVSEFSHYFLDGGNYSDRIAELTPYAMAKGAESGSGANTGTWWLRSPGAYTFSAAYVDSIGALRECRADYPGYVIRPVMWVDLRAAGVDH